MPRFRASAMNDDLPFVRVVDHRGKVMEHVIAVDTDVGKLWRFRLDGGKLPPPEPDGRMPREVVEGKFRLQFKELADDRPDDEVEWLPWVTGDHPPFRAAPAPELE